MATSDTFYVTYQFSAHSYNEAENEASQIAVEQSAELPYETIPEKLHHYVGTVENLRKLHEHRWESKICYNIEIVNGDPVQFLNVIFGNVSIKPGIKISGLDRTYLSGLLPGPKFGINGVRELLNEPDRPLSCTALKPVGSSPKELAALAGEFSSGGIDVIKDDHGLANQTMADFKTRIKYCVDAIRHGEQGTGKKTLYFPNITGSHDEVLSRYELARHLGADGVLMAPQLTGLNTLSELATSEIDLPVMTHPAFSGPFTIHHNSGFEPSVYFGSLWRAFGADCIIYPNAGGRFSYTVQQCLDINMECRNSELALRRSFPVPAGGVDRNSIETLMRDYGSDTLFLIGGSLYKHPKGLKSAAKEFQSTLTDK